MVMRRIRTVIRRGDLSLVGKLLAHNVRFSTIFTPQDGHPLDSIYLERIPLVNASRSDELGLAIFYMMLDTHRDMGITPDHGTIIHQDEGISTALAIRVKQLGRVHSLVERGANVNVPAVRGVE